jgi:hypothetical protein
MDGALTSELSTIVFCCGIAVVWALGFIGGNMA